MPASLSTLRQWFREGQAQGATHMVVKCDTFEYKGGPGDACCYPIYCHSGNEAREKANEGGDRLMEVYNLRKPEEPQFRMGRVFDYDDVDA